MVEADIPASRRSNGEGSVGRFRDGWRAQIVLDGVRRQFLGKTRKEAHDRMRKAQRDVEQGMPAKPTVLSVAQFLEDWLRVVVVTKRPSTAEDYASKVRIHLLPAIGDIPLVRLSANDLEKLQAEKVGEGLSRSIPRIRQVIHRALTVAVKKRLVNRNVADEVEWLVPESFEAQALTVDKARRLLRVCLVHPMGAAVVVALCTGMRKGELFALRWRDINLGEGNLWVRHSLAVVKGTGPIIGPTKTRRSRRPLPIPPLVVRALGDHRVHQEEVRALAGSAWDDQDLVFANEVGRPIHVGNFHSRVFKPLLAQAGLRRIRFHDLRHSMATLLYGMGADPQTLKSLLGHSKITTTMDTYTHPVSVVQRAEVDRLAEALGGEALE